MEIAVDNKGHFSAPLGAQNFINSLYANIIVVFLQLSHHLLLTSSVVVTGSVSQVLRADTTQQMLYIDVI